MTTAAEILLENPGKRIVLAHGCFDILHPGHIMLLEKAKSAGDILVVSVTADAHVNKGVGRPIMTLQERMAVVGALKTVDYVLPSYAPDSGSILAELQPHVYVKGDDYDEASLLPVEREALSKGTEFLQVAKSDDSTSALVARIKDARPDHVQEWLRGFRQRHSLGEIDDALARLSEATVLIVGEQIRDVYTFVEPLAKSPREYFMSSRIIANQVHEGGTKAVLNHLYKWIGKSSQLITQTAEINKQRFIHQGSGVKLFGAQGFPDAVLDEEQRAMLPGQVAQAAHDSDCTLALDYGHGFFDDTLRRVVSGHAQFLAVNCQTNSANYGYNLAAKWGKSDFMVLDGPEYALAKANGWSQHRTKMLFITRGKDGCDYGEIMPSFARKVVDNVGAGDALFGFAACLIGTGALPEVAAFVGSCAAALQCEVFGNAHAIEPEALWKLIEELMES